ncbi:MAG: electron transport complex subunit RsxB [Candidatus Competibacterales bacterium]
MAEAVVLGAVALGVLALALGLGLGVAARALGRENDPVVARIDALLPQTQCAQCGFPGCRPYAQAIAEGRADIDQCPPGGEATVAALAALLNRPAKGLNPAYGQERPPLVAAIDEGHCIGCTLCIQACPVDAIVGASGQMHTVIAAQCTGCELCVNPCPVDCIHLQPPPPEPVVWQPRLPPPGLTR